MRSTRGGIVKSFGVLLAIIAVGVGVALTYHVFENAVHKSIELVWYDWFGTNAHRWRVVPLAIAISLIFFGLQHYLDPATERHEEHGLGDMPKPTVRNYLRVLLIGYFSLLAGAALGPEAILVPACMLLGAYAGSRLFADKQIANLLAAAGIMALFTAFFNSFVVGVLSLWLVLGQAKVRLNQVLLLTAIIASASSYLTLQLVGGKAYTQLPAYSWGFSFTDLLGCLVLAVAGYTVVMAMAGLQRGFDHVRRLKVMQAWWWLALLAASGIAGLYLLGGDLVEFTGNLSIVPMFHQAAALGVLGLVWVLVIKTAVISWSKAIGYRGGLIFPTIFVAAVLVAMVQLYDRGFNVIYGLIAVLIGAFVANHTSHILA